MSMVAEEMEQPLAEVEEVEGTAVPKELLALAVPEQALVVVVMLTRLVVPSVPLLPALRAETLPADRPELQQEDPQEDPQEDQLASLLEGLVEGLLEGLSEGLQEERLAVPKAVLQQQVDRLVVSPQPEGEHRLPPQWALALEDRS